MFPLFHMTTLLLRHRESHLQRRPSYGEMTYVASLKFLAEIFCVVEILYNVMQRPVGHDQRAYRLCEDNAALQL